jgi:hypothetical protein
MNQAGTAKIEMLNESPDLSNIASDGVLYLASHGLPGALMDDDGNEISMAAVILALADPRNGLPVDFHGTIRIGACYAGVSPSESKESKAAGRSGGSVVDLIAAGLKQAGRQGIEIIGPLNPLTLAASASGREVHVRAIDDGPFMQLYQNLFSFCEGNLEPKRAAQLVERGIDRSNFGIFRRLRHDLKEHLYVAMDHVVDLLKTTDWTAELGQRHVFLPEASAYQRVKLPSRTAGPGDEASD